jgi:hypothetical protein
MKHFKFKDGLAEFRNHPDYSGTAITQCLNGFNISTKKTIDQENILIKKKLEFIDYDNTWGTVRFYKNKVRFYPFFEDTSVQEVHLDEFLEYLKDESEYQNFRTEETRKDSFFKETYNESKFSKGKLFFETVKDILEE